MGIFSGYERALLVGISETLLPQTTILTLSATDAGVARLVEGHLERNTRNIRWAFRAALVLIDWSCRLTKGRGFHRLEGPRRVAVLEAWRTSRLYLRRLLIKLVESNCLLAYYSIPEVFRRLGYEPPPINKRTPLARHEGSIESNTQLEADVCVIGAGAGGAVVAKELSEKGRSVILIEEGGYFGREDFKAGALETMEKIYHNAGTQMTLGLPCIVLPTGKAVGGTTIINSGTCFRLPDKILSKWREKYGLRDLRDEDVRPYFERVERQLHVEPVSEAILGNNSKIFRRGLEKMGLKGFPLARNVKHCTGQGMCCFGCPTDAKQSVNLSYIPEAVERGTRLFVRCKVERVVPHGGDGGTVHARFIDLQGRPGRRLQVRAKAVVAAAGTLKTPYLLRKSGIALGNGHVGRHLTIHPTGKIIGFFEEEVRGWEGVPQGYCYDGMAREGIMFEGAFVPPAFAAINMDLPPREHKETMEQFRHLATFGFLISDKGRGGIRWLPNGEPLIYYSIHKSELRDYLRGIRFLTEVFLAAGAKKILTGLKRLPIVTPETGLNGFDRLVVKRSELEIAAFHPLGTCRMGVDEKSGVVNTWGEVHGVRNLFIADGSIFPSSLGVNPQETIMAFANRTADYIHSRLP